MTRMGDQEQYEADLAQALALSLETHAIETLRRQERPASQQPVQSPQTWPQTAGAGQCWLQALSLV